jgi:integrase/recombinase XerD
VLIELFEQFARELEYLRGSSDETIALYRRIVKRFTNACGDVMPTKPLLNQVVISMREHGYAITTCNITIRGFNSFLVWLAENDHCEKLKMNKLKEDKRTVPDVPIESLKRLLKYKPKSPTETRIQAMALILIDTGCRIKEMRFLKPSKVDFDNCVISVIGKGNKERIIPISPEGRRVLFNHLKSHTQELVFSTRDGEAMLYSNARRDLKRAFEDNAIRNPERKFVVHCYRASEKCKSLNLLCH